VNDVHKWGRFVMSNLNLDEYENRMRNDPRTNDELISAALFHASDDDLYWNAVLKLHRRDTQEVLSRAKELCHSSLYTDRRLGADLLGQLGICERTFPKECLAALLEMFNCEGEAKVLQSILIALGHLHQPEAIVPASRYCKHPNPEVRFGVVSALTGHDDQRAIDMLIELSHDEDSHVRDWATFGLGTISDLDIPALRDALAERLNDVDFDTRCEAIVGLAKRKDSRVVPVIAKELASDCVGSLVVEAVTMIPSTEFYPQLIALKEWWDVDTILLDEAIKLCSHLTLCEKSTEK
jgi:HEAT repeat protein